MTLARLCRCHPFGTSGLDFVPASLPDHSRWYLPWRYGRWRGTNDRPSSPRRRAAETARHVTDSEAVVAPLRAIV